MNRILWNKRGEDIDEIVLHDVSLVHIEQMSDDCWWIGLTLPNGAYWDGNFSTDEHGRLTFTEQENAGVEWRDDSHEEAV